MIGKCIVFPDLSLQWIDWFLTFDGIDVGNIWVIFFCECRKMCFGWKFWMLFFICHDILLKVYILNVFLEERCSKNIVFYICYCKFNIEISILTIYFGKTCHRNIVYYWYFSLVGDCRNFARVFSMSFGSLRFNLFAIT